MPTPGPEVLMPFALAKLCFYFATFAVMPFSYRKARKEAAKCRKGFWVKPKNKIDDPKSCGFVLNRAKYRTRGLDRLFPSTQM
jgi:hypothetical protein